MTARQDGPGSEPPAPLWETLPLPDPPDDGGGAGSTPAGSGSGQRWEAYSPPLASGAGEVVAEPPPADTEPPRRPPAAAARATLAVALACGVGAVAISGILTPPSGVAPVAHPPGLAAPDPVAPPPDPVMAEPGGVPLPGVVAVFGQQFSTSGLVMDADGTVVVPYHPLATAVSARISVLAPGGERMDATMAGFDATRDIAVLSVPGLDTEAPNPAGEAVRVGDPVEVSSYAIGRFGAGSDYASTVSTTVLETGGRTAVELVWTEFFAEVSGLLQLRLDAAGDGGVGQAVYASGDVAGLVVDQDGASGYAVPIADLADVVSIVRAGTDSGSVRVGPPGSLGLSLDTHSSDTGGWPRVATVQPFGPAAEAGIKEGDLLIRVGEVSLNALEQRSISPAAVLRMLEPESPVAVSWRSAASGKEQSATLVPTTATGY